MKKLLLSTLVLCGVINSLGAMLPRNDQEAIDAGIVLAYTAIKECERSSNPLNYCLSRKLDTILYKNHGTAYHSNHALANRGSTSKEIYRRALIEYSFAAMIINEEVNKKLKPKKWYWPF